MGRYEYQIQADVNTPWGHFKATASTIESFYVALDEVAYKLGKQFQKTKEKHQHHKKPDHSKHAQIERLNEQLEYDNSPYTNKRSAS
jgi:ribosome-associated translation inhibitor RaiA